jgi:hypothetical protein
MVVSLPHAVHINRVNTIEQRLVPFDFMFFSLTRCMSYQENLTLQLGSIVPSGAACWSKRFIQKCAYRVEAKNNKMITTISSLIWKIYEWAMRLTAYSFMISNRRCFVAIAWAPTIQSWWRRWRLAQQHIASCWYDNTV